MSYSALGGGGGAGAGAASGGVDAERGTRTDDGQQLFAGLGKDAEFGEPLDVVDEQIRAGFVRKVFGVLAAQLAVTFAIIAVFSLVGSVHDYVDMRRPDAHAWPFLAGMLVSFACLITLSCCANQARTHPNNVVFLSIFTVAEGVMLGVMCAAFDVEAILLAVGITAVVVAGLVAYALSTKRDFTGAGPYLFTGLWVLVLYGLIVSLVPPLRTTQLAYSAIGVVLFSFYLVYDVQLIAGAKHARFRFGVDDWVFAALNVYLDVVQLFVRILEIISRERR